MIDCIIALIKTLLYGVFDWPVTGTAFIAADFFSFIVERHNSII